MDDRPFPEDIVAQGSERGPRFTFPGWRPSRAAGILAIVTLLAGLAVAWYNLLLVLYPYGWYFVWQTP